MISQINVSTPGAGCEFFGRFDFINDIALGQPYIGFCKGRDLLNLIQDICPNFYESVHKGTPFYWLGVAAFLISDFETALFFTDAAISEDIKVRCDLQNPPPAIKFMQLREDGHAAGSLVNDAADEINRAIKVYNKIDCRNSNGNELTIDLVREHLLLRSISPDSGSSVNLRTISTSLISYFLELRHKRSLRKLVVGSGTAEPFFLHLFKGCVVFESLLRAKLDRQQICDSLDRMINNVKDRLGLTKNINAGDSRLQQILCCIRSDSTCNSIDNSLKYTAQLRNAVAHNFAWCEDFSIDDYNKLVTHISSSCLHAINCLYLPSSGSSSSSP